MKKNKKIWSYALAGALAVSNLSAVAIPMTAFASTGAQANGSNTDGVIATSGAELSSFAAGTKESLKVNGAKKIALVEHKETGTLADEVAALNDSDFVDVAKGLSLSAGDYSVAYKSATDLVITADPDAVTTKKVYAVVSDAPSNIAAAATTEYIGVTVTSAYTAEIKGSDGSTKFAAVDVAGGKSVEMKLADGTVPGHGEFVWELGSGTSSTLFSIDYLNEDKTDILLNVDEKANGQKATVKVTYYEDGEASTLTDTSAAVTSIKGNSNAGTLSIKDNDAKELAGETVELTAGDTETLFLSYTGDESVGVAQTPTYTYQILKGSDVVSINTTTNVVTAASVSETSEAIVQVTATVPYKDSKGNNIGSYEDVRTVTFNVVPVAEQAWTITVPTEAIEFNEGDTTEYSIEAIVDAVNVPNYDSSKLKYTWALQAPASGTTDATSAITLTDGNKATAKISLKDNSFKAGGAKLVLTDVDYGTTAIIDNGLIAAGFEDLVTLTNYVATGTNANNGLTVPIAIKAEGLTVSADKDTIVYNDSSDATKNKVTFTVTKANGAEASVNSRVIYKAGDSTKAAQTIGSWSSNVLTISGITSAKAGNYIIELSDSLGRSGSWSLKVLPENAVAATGVKLDIGSYKTSTIGTNANVITATVLPSDSTNKLYASVRDVKVDSSNEDVFTATAALNDANDATDTTSNITIITKKAGKGTLTVTSDDGSEAKCEVIVEGLAGITVSGGNEVEVGKTLNLTADVEAYGDTVNTVKWSSSNSSIATVNDGVVTGIKEGTVTITATSTFDSSVKDAVKITVKKASEEQNPDEQKQDDQKQDETKPAEETKAADGSAKDAPAAAGTALKDAAGAETGFVVTNATKGAATVEYVGTAADKTKKSLTVPATATDLSGNTYAVTSIAKNAFKGDKKLTKVTIPSSIKEIKAGAFKNAKNLKKVTINAGGKLTVAKSAFKGLKKGSTIKVKGSNKKANIKTIKKAVTASKTTVK